MSKSKFAALKNAKSVQNTAQQEQWKYPTIGFSTASGIIYLDGDEVNEVTGVALEYRQWKEVNTGSEEMPQWVRYDVKTPLAQMKQGVKTVYRTQVIMKVDGKLYVFGAKTLTAAKLFTNEAAGRGHNSDYQVGIIPSLLNEIAECKAETGVQTGLSSWSFTINNGVEVKNHRSNRMMQAMGWSGFEWVGEDEMIANDDLYASENLAEWVDDWKSGAADIAGYDVSAITEDDPADVIPGFDSQEPDGFDL